MTDLAEDLLAKRQISGLRFTYWARLIAAICGMIVTFLAARSQLDLIISTVALLILSGLSIFFIMQLKKEDCKRYYLIGITGAVLDSLVLLILPWSWYFSVGGSDVPFAFLFKSSFHVVAIGFIAINAFALCPRYPLIVTASSVLVSVIMLVVGVMDERTIFTSDYLLSNLSSAVHIGKFVTDSILVAGIGLMIILMTVFAGNTVREAVRLQEKVIQQEKKVLVGELAAGLAHEIKNQLNSVSFLDMITTRLTEEEKEYIRFVRDSRERISGLVNEFRVLARNDSIHYQMDRVDIDTILDDAVKLARMDDQAKKTKISIENREKLYINANKNKIIQVLLNLFRNAVHAMESTSMGTIRVFVSREGDNVLLKISDNGSGIPKERLKLIWEPFFTTKGDEGTGIGLDISKQIVMNHEGTIECESVVGKGTVFIITLPLAA